ncbi:neuromodulin isoform X1 [Cydia pomonella]|uniref:neuromodulin isoform X1 n=2 Tax=Cydia pomonella TaxID=82600 RepID=UPI002ADD8260|nr:neuromodulin isoform X1 [Cydia pomonella]
MGCNTSADAKAAKEETGANGAQEKESSEKNNQNHTNAVPVKGKDDKSPTEEEAATKIQAAFRGHQTRKSITMKTSKPQQQQQQQQEPEPTRAELEAEFRADDKDLCNAATKIQASFRGHQARKVTQAEKDKELQDLQDKEDIEKIDLTDPDLNKAATKIQASFRGHKVRKDVPN